MAGQGLGMKQSRKTKTVAAAKKHAARKSVTKTVRAPKLAQLKRKYGARAIDGLVRVQPDHALEHVEWCDAVDQHFTRLWLGFNFGGMTGRSILDERTRSLITVGQFLVMEDKDQFA